MTVESEYTINSLGFITDPGKFEGEASWVPLAHDSYLDGGWEFDIGTDDTRPFMTVLDYSGVMTRA